MGVGVSLILIAAGAILTWAVNATVSGLDINTIGVILLVVGAIGLVLSLMFWSSWGGVGGATRRRTTYVEDGPAPFRGTAPERAAPSRPLTQLSRTCLGRGPRRLQIDPCDTPSLKGRSHGQASAGRGRRACCRGIHCRRRRRVVGNGRVRMHRASRPPTSRTCFEPAYTAGCSGHDEPELDPVSAAPGSASNLTWRSCFRPTVRVPVSAVGPTFWFGGAGHRPEPEGLFGEGFLEVQFYPNGILRELHAERRLRGRSTRRTRTPCARPSGRSAPPDKNRSTTSLPRSTRCSRRGSKHSPMVMHAGDTIDLHFHLGRAR